MKSLDIDFLSRQAIIESTESSNRIEGITVPAKRFKELMAHPVISPGTDRSALWRKRGNNKK